MSEPLRVAVVGAGMMGRHHALAIRRSPSVAALAAVADSSPEFARGLGEELGAPSYTDIDALTGEVRADVVHVVTSPGLRVVWYPTPLLALTSWTLTRARRIARTGRTAVDLRSAFTAPRCDTVASRAISDEMRSEEAPVALR